MNPADASAGPAPNAPVLEASGLSKSFGAVEVLKGIDLAVRAGEVQAIIGENGAGKSTLMKILAGNQPPSRGEIRIDGEAVSFSGPADAESRGIVLVHQEILLAPDLTVAQNIYLGREIGRGAGFHPRPVRHRRIGGVQRVVGHKLGHHHLPAGTQGLGDGRQDRFGTGAA